MTQGLGRDIAVLFQEWSAAYPDRFLPPRKTQYSFNKRLSGPHCRSERAENLVPTGIFRSYVSLAWAITLPVTFAQLFFIECSMVLAKVKPGIFISAGHGMISVSVDVFQPPTASSFDFRVLRRAPVAFS